MKNGGRSVIKNIIRKYLNINYNIFNILLRYLIIYNNIIDQEFYKHEKTSERNKGRAV